MVDEEDASHGAPERPLSPETRIWLEELAKSHGWTYLEAELWFRSAQRHEKTPAEIARSDQFDAFLDSPEGAQMMKEAEQQMNECPTSSLRRIRKLQKPDQN